MKRNYLHVLAEVAVMAALAFALDALQGGIFRGLFPNGGSIGFAMLPILVLTYRRGFIAGFLSALIMSFLQMMGGIYTIANTWYMVIIQVLLDYVLAYPLVSVCGIFTKAFKTSKTRKEKIMFLSIGGVIGGLLKLLSHYLAGVIFWRSSCPDGYFGGPEVYSLVYNGSFMIPNIIINVALLILILIKAPKIFEPNEIKGGKNDEKEDIA